MIWHVLDVRAIWVKEFASALAAQVPTLGWCPRITNDGMFRKDEEEITLADPLLQIRYFPLQRGFAKFPMNLFAREGERLARRLRQRSTAPEQSALICCSPHYADVAERWPGPVIYYATDLFVAWGDDPKRIESFERRMCKVAKLVCPDSQRIADHLIANCGCEVDKIHLSPMATRGANVLSQPPGPHLDQPADISDMPRPVAGVIGNLSANMDWELLQETITRIPWLSWVFVGPTDMPINDPLQRQARDLLMRQEGRVRFVGSKPYGQLKDYARACDVAVLPYRRVEPTYSGSSTRFYEHLAACKPIIATRGFAELLHKEPLLRLVNNAAELAQALGKLRHTNFHDGQEERRCRASQAETWEQRASSMIGALSERVGREQEAA
jgi:glycosyltransferase involved in cell wall biosynthesis